jgi:hypothetical protein
MYTIKTDKKAALISISIQGFWTVTEVRNFAAALGQQAAALRALGKDPALFYDYTDAVIQSQDVVAALSDLARAAPAQARKVAVYTEGLLARRQARRVAATSDKIRLFDERAAALEWLAQP